jgi:hypothetical protein
MPGERVELTPVLEGLGTPRFLSAGDGTALARLSLPSLGAPLGRDAAVIILARAAAVAAASSALGQASDLLAGSAPRPVELSASFFRDPGAGPLTAEAQTLYRGRSSVVVDVKVRDEHPGLVATLVVTQLASRDRGAAAEPARRAS